MAISLFFLLSSIYRNLCGGVGGVTLFGAVIGISLISWKPE